MEKPNVIFASRAEGIGKNAVVISTHKNYDFSYFLLELLLKGVDDVEGYDILSSRQKWRKKIIGN